MAGPDLTLLPGHLLGEGRRGPELECPTSFEDHDQLLVRRMAVRGRTCAAGLEVPVVDAGMHGTGLAREAHPLARLPLVGGLGRGEVEHLRRLGLARMERR